MKNNYSDNFFEVGSKFGFLPIELIAFEILFDGVLTNAFLKLYAISNYFFILGS